MEGQHLAVAFSGNSSESVNRFRQALCNHPNGKSIRCKIAADIPAKSLTSQKKRIDMLDETTILPLLKDTENERTERTVSINATEKFGQAICAFANDIMNTGKPGYLFIGADNDGKPSGLHFTDELQKNLAGMRSEGNILPQPVMQVYKVTLPKGDIAVVEVQPSKLPPVRFRGRIWIRIGARKAIANDEEERILMERREFNTPGFESEPCLNATIEDLDLDLFHSTLLPAMVDEKEIKKDKRPIEVQLASLGLFYIPYNCPTNAGILLIGKNPTRFIPSASIQYVQFEGLTKGTKVLNEYLFKGNLLTELKNLDNFSEFTLQRKRPQLVTALRDKTFIGYPYKATRELLMNICQHRAYNGSNSPAHVYEYADRLEFDNTGNLYGKARPENFPMETDYRNPLISGVMRALGFVNRFGMGIRLVADELKANGNPPAEYIFSEPSSFKVIVKSADPHEFQNGTNETQVETHVDTQDDTHVKSIKEIRLEKLIQLIRKHPDSTMEEMAGEIGISRSSIYRLIKSTGGKILYKGDQYHGEWTVLED